MTHSHGGATNQTHPRRRPAHAETPPRHQPVPASSSMPACDALSFLGSPRTPKPPCLRGGHAKARRPRLGDVPRRGRHGKKSAASYSPALRRSTIGATGLNFSVRDGKRWSPSGWEEVEPRRNGHLEWMMTQAHKDWQRKGERGARAAGRRAGGNGPGRPTHCGGARRAEGFGQLVALGFGVAAFAPAPYQRRGLRRP